MLWHKPAAVALIRPLAWEPPYAARIALKKQKIKIKNKKNNILNLSIQVSDSFFSRLIALNGLDFSYLSASFHTSPYPRSLATPSPSLTVGALM